MICESVRDEWNEQAVRLWCDDEMRSNPDSDTYRRAYAIRSMMRSLLESRTKLSIARGMVVAACATMTRIADKLREADGASRDTANWALNEISRFLSEFGDGGKR